MTQQEWLAAGLSLVIMLVGLAGVVVPVLPDVWLIWLGALLYGLLAGFDGWLGGIIMVVLSGLTILGVALDLALGSAAAKQGGASWQAIAASFTLALLGLLFFPPFGSILGALIGLFGVEYIRRGHNADEALTAVKHYVMGCGWSVVLRFGIGVLMIILWGAWVWFGRGA
jgi:uncharacterized protein YqgC (DUF456 family)